MRELMDFRAEIKETESAKPAKTEKVIATLRPKPGQKVWELNLKTRLIVKAEYKDEKVKIIQAVNMVTRRPQGMVSRVVRDVDRKENCLYCCAINAENADKQFFKMLGIPYPKKKK